MDQSISSLKSVLEGFRLLNHRFEIERWQNDHLAFIALLSGWQTLHRMLKHLERLTAPNYNVFYVMKNMGASEVKLHSPFLADLFNIHGEHKQGDLFYRELVELLKLPTSLYLPVDIEWFKVQTEVACGAGRIDILISYENGAQKFAIAIENKIYAGDREQQLEKYHEYLVKRFRENFTLLYLTPYGHAPTSSSASTEFLQNNHVPLLSYQHDIASLLKSTIPQIVPVGVRSVLEQYLVVCQGL